jgi:intracellular multiplication protein IcmD
MKDKGFFKRYTSIKRGAVWAGAMLLCSSYIDVSAQPATIQAFANNIMRTFSLLRDVMTVAAYAAGVGFSIIGLLKFKAHKDNPAQIPLSTPIALIAVSAGLLFLPTVFDIAGDAVFGSSATAGLNQKHERYIL